MEHVDVIRLSAISYAGRNEDIVTESSRTVKLTNEDISETIAEVYLGDISNGQTVQFFTKGTKMGDGEDVIYGMEYTVYVNPSGDASYLSGPSIATQPTVPDPEIPQPRADDNRLFIEGINGTWTSLVTIV